MYLGSTGMIAVQLAKGVSKHNWIKESDFGGADYVINDYNRVVDQVKDIRDLSSI